MEGGDRGGGIEVGLPGARGLLMGGGGAEGKLGMPAGL